MRKFQKAEIDLLYESIEPNEEVLWRGKPRLIPNISFLSTVGLAIISLILLLVFRLISGKTTNIIDDWFSITLIIIIIVFVLYFALYTHRYYRKMSDIFYCITNNRLLIFNSRKKRIIYSKLYPMIKILRLKRSIFDNGTIVFDIEFDDERLIEIGFNNIENAEEVLDIINHQLHHLRSKQ